MGHRQTDRAADGKNNHTEATWKRKKLESVCASNTSFAETAIHESLSADVNGGAAKHAAR